MKILIVGAGIGGLALGGFLKQKNISVQIIEKNNWDLQGYSLGIWSNGRSIMQLLGLGKQFDMVGMAVKNYKLVKGNGKQLYSLDFGQFRECYKPADTLIRRSDLLHLLRTACQGISIQTKRTVVSLEQANSGVKVIFSDGTQDTFDAVVGADGIHSSVRDLVFGKQYLQYTDWRVYFFTAFGNLNIGHDVIQVSEKGQFFGLFPNKDGKITVALACPVHHSVIETPSQRIELLKKKFRDCTWLLNDLLNKVSPSEIYASDIGYVQIKCWVNNRVALIGDAAHALQPFGGMGASMALEDAYILAHELAKVTAENIPDALLNYQHLRRERIHKMRRKTNIAGRFFKLRRMFFLRNIFIRILPQKSIVWVCERLLKESIR